MQNDVISKIDALVKMSESSSNAATLKVELRELECEIKEKRLDLKELKSSITDDKYFDATGEIVDKNIEISLNKKIRAINKSIADVDSKISKAKIEEENKYKEVESLKKILEESDEFIKVLNTKITSNNTLEKESFEVLLKETEEKKEKAIVDLEKASKEYEKIQGKLEVLSFSKKELKNKLEEDTEKLIDVKSNLLNRRGYVNSELKKEDEERINELENKIAKLEEEKKKIVSDPVMIAEEAKNYLIDDDKTGALKKVKELRDLLLEQPYMDLDSNTSKEALNIELENAEAKRDEFASMIASKNYESSDTTLLKDRIDFIKDKKKKLQDEIDKLKKEIKRVDTKDLEDLSNRINYCESEANKLKEKIEEYQQLLDSEDLTINKKASLQASFDKKKEELNNVEELLDLYKSDRRELITKSYNLENVDIKEMEEEIEKIDIEKKKLEKLCATSNKVKDVISIENDKATLKELNETVKAIKKRKSLKYTPSEIYDEIEMLIGTDSYEISDEAYDESIYIDESSVKDNIDDFVIDIDDPKDIIEDNKDENLVEDEEETDDVITPLEDLELDFNEVTDDDIPDINDISIDSIPVVDDSVLDLNITDINDDKIKVIDVEPLDNTSSSDDKNEDDTGEFLIGDYIS